jgi:hypothetical protein
LQIPVALRPGSSVFGSVSPARFNRGQRIRRVSRRPIGTARIGNLPGFFFRNAKNYEKNDQNRTSGAVPVAFAAFRLLFELSSSPDTA